MLTGCQVWISSWHSPAWPCPAAETADQVSSPYRFEAPWDAYEFASHVLESKSRLVIMSMAWLTRDDQETFCSVPDKPDMETLSYWVARLKPLIQAKGDEEIIVVFCNRTGIEDEATYAGTSAVIGIRDGEVRLYGLLGRGVEELLVVDTDKEPRARLAYHSQPAGDEEDSTGPGQG